MKYRPHIHRPRASAQAFTPVQLCQAYSLPRLKGPFKPWCIGLVELGGGYQMSDVTQAAALYGQPAPKVTTVSVDGGKNSPGQDPDSDGEVALDIEVAAAVYTYLTGLPADIRVYFAPNSNSSFFNAFKAGIALPVSTLSCSWGGPEDSWGTAEIAQFDALFATAYQKGVTLTAAAGDNDSGDGESGTHVDFPGSSPHVVCCGGTTHGSGVDTVWNSGPGEGTGGGFSTYFPVQAWQLGAPSGPGRMVPDVAADADPATGYQIVLDGAVQVFGGTSAVAPFYAGFFAALNAVKNGAGKFHVGNVLPFLYRHPAAFTDVTSGNNGQWRAGVGVDPCTGLGVLNGAALASAILGPLA